MYITAQTILTKRISIFIFAFLVVQMMIFGAVLEFIRKPWLGKELEIEKNLSSRRAESGNKE